MLLVASCGPDGRPPGPWLDRARILVPGVGVTNQDCRADICPHNENTDLIRWKDAIYLIHRTAMSQVLGPNSSLHVYRSVDQGAHFTHLACIEASVDRDIRDPHFFIVGDLLCFKALTRVPGVSTRDTGAQTLAVESCSTDGAAWSERRVIGPTGYGFWRVVERDGTYYSAAYRDGDDQVVLFSSTDGASWTQGPVIYDVAADTPSETELTFTAAGRMLALIRMDGTDTELLGDQGRLRTKVCWAEPPYGSFDCPQELSGQRLDGPVAFWDRGRLFVAARKHLQGTGKKRTALFEIEGGLEGGTLSIKEWGELPSAGDTAYLGAVRLDADRFLVSWYAGDLDADEIWFLGMMNPSDIWIATLEPRALK
jgi:hypothetical protein